MRLTAVAACVAALLAPTYALSAFSGGVANPFGDDDDDKTRIPGDSPLKFCSLDHEDDLVVIERVDLNPNPPLAYDIYTV